MKMIEKIKSLAEAEAIAAYDIYIAYGLQPVIIQLNTMTEQELFHNEFSKKFSKLMEGGGIRK